MQFLKQILPPGTYWVNTLDGKRRKEVFSRERLARMAKTATEMAAAGLSIPAPWSHTDAAPVALGTTPTGISAKKPTGKRDARDNAGFWNKIYQSDPDGTLWGMIEAPNAADAEKIGSTVREVSPLIKPEWTDGTGRVWNDAILHVALVTNPIVPGQENFKPVPSTPALALSDCIAVALSHFISPETEALTAEEAESVLSNDPADIDANNIQTDPNNNSAPSLQDVISLMRDLGLELPDDTNLENIVERFVIAARTHFATKAQCDEDDPGNAANRTQPGKKPGQSGSKGQVKEQPSPVAMADASADNLISDGHSAGTSTSGFTMSETLIKIASDSIRRDYQRRIDDLVSTGRLSPAYVKKSLTPHLAGFQLSIDEATGEQNRSSLDDILEALEALPENTGLVSAPLTSRASRGVLVKQRRDIAALAHEEADPTELGDELSETDIDDVLSQQFSAAGRPEASQFKRNGSIVE